MLDFFEHVPATDIASHDDADMLLFEFGTYAWNDGRFSTSLTRQLIYADGDDDDIFQLRLQYLYAPDDSLKAIGGGHEWHMRTDQLAAFRLHVFESNAFQLAEARQHAEADLSLSTT